MTVRIRNPERRIVRSMKQEMEMNNKAKAYTARFAKVLDYIETHLHELLPARVHNNAAGSWPIRDYNHFTVSPSMLALQVMQSALRA